MARRNTNKHTKKKQGCGCFSVFVILLLFIVIGSVGLFFYRDYKNWEAQKADFEGMVKITTKTIPQAMDQANAEECITTLIRQMHKKETMLSDIHINLSYPNQPFIWTANQEVTIKASASLYTKNPFLETSIKKEEVITLLCTSKELTMIPGYVNQLGVRADYTNYNYFFDKWHNDTKQRAIADKWNALGRAQSNDIATLNGYYLVAVRPRLGNCGEILNVVLDDGTSFDCIIADEKGEDAGNDWGHIKSQEISLVEFEVIGNDADSLAPNFVPPADWKGKKVSAIINKGMSKELETILSEIR